MVGKKNLIPLPERTKEEQRKIQSEGGKKSGEARRRKKTLKACMQMILELPVADIGARNALSIDGVKPEEIDNKMLMTMALFKKAATGDVAAYKEICSVIGEDNDAEKLKLSKKELSMRKKQGSNSNNDDIVIKIEGGEDYGG